VVIVYITSRKRDQGSSKIPEATSLGCDYLLNLEGGIVFAPEKEDIVTRYQVTQEALSH